MQRPVLCLFLLLSCACASGPTEIIPYAFALPGGQLSGDEGVAESWSDIIVEGGVLDLETRPDDPYSVRIGFMMKGDRIYVDPSEGRKWLPNLQADSRVRVRIERKVYPAKAVLVSDASELEGFDPARHVFRLDLQTNE